MSDRATLTGRALSLMIVVLMALTGLFAIALTLAPAAQAASCSQTNALISGNWIINSPQVCSGITYTVDGSVFVVSGGSLTLQNGGLSFLEDTAHKGRFLTVYGGGSLTLQNSIVTTQTYAIDPYLYLNVSVNGASSFSMTAGSMLQFPGWFNTSAGATVTLWNSKITGFSASSLGNLFASGSQVDLNDNAPVISWTNTNAYLYQSNLSKLFEDPVAQVMNAQAMSLSGSNLYAYDTYIGIDYSNNAFTHNTLSLSATSHAYLYNLTIDLSESPGSLSQYQTAFTVDGTSAAYLLRWFHATVTDSAGELVAGAGIWSRQSPTPTTETYPETATATPSAVTLAYLGKSSGNWNVTGANGQALIPLWTDTLTSTSAPNANSFGSFTETAAYSIYQASGGVAFPPYPSLSTTANNQYATLALSTAPICPGTPITWSTTTTFSQTVSVSSSVVITGHITISSGSLFVQQSQTACAYVMVASGGSLTLVNASISSNYPIVLAVAGTGSLAVTQGSYLGLSVASSYGLLRSNATATVTISDSTVNANVSLAGGAATFVRDTLLGPNLYVDTSALVKMYDVNLNAVRSISLLTDLGLITNLAFDIRNVTFSSTLTPQLHFSGTQYVQLTNVGLYDPTGTWYLGMIGGNAVVNRYWWMALNDVDGTGTLLANASATILLQKINPQTLAVVAAPNPLPGNTIYFTSSTTWPVSAPSGTVLYRAYQDSWTANGAHTVDDTYVVGGSATVQSTTFYPDANVTTTVTADTSVDLKFSSLTPDFSVISVIITGVNGVSYLQPLNVPMTIQATIHNAGQITVKNVVVDFFSTNVDSNNDQIMDSPVAAYQAAGTLIGSTAIPQITGSGNAVITTAWTFQGSFETSTIISIVVNPPVSDPAGPGAIPETNMRNNIATQTVNLFAWPDLAITGPTDVSFSADAVANNNVFVNVTVHNLGTAAANGAFLLIKEGNVQVSNVVSFNILAGQALTLPVTWHPTTEGYHNITIYALAPNGTDPRTIDYVFSNNWYRTQRNVLSQPDLALNSADYTPMTEPQNTPFPVLVHVYNLGQTPVSNTSVAIYLNGNYSAWYGRVDGIAVIHETNVSVTVSGLPSPGANQVLNILVNPSHTLVEGGQGYANDYANVTITVTPPIGTIILQSPASASIYGPSDQISVAGVVRDNTQAGNGIPNLPLVITIVDSSNNVVYGPFNKTTDVNGVFQLTVILPGTLPDGTYTLRVASSSGTGIPAATPTIVIHRNVSFLFTPVPLLGIQWWLFLVILAAVAAIVIGVTVYFKVYGLGKMVECGECGAFISEDATVCPKCGVEFEKDMAKCSNCQAWIPVDVKQCPECGVEFATGEVEMADYQEKMRLQYDEVVAKFKEDASRQLGRAMSDKEFQEWWRKQPTFLTFEDWLREEEEMRKMGSRPCPVCGTLNSVTATVCHKCGSLMKEEKRPPSGGTGAGGMAPSVRQRAAQPAPGPTVPPAEPLGGPQAGAGPEAVPRRVIRKPVTPAPVVQKKVIKRPVAEGEQSSSTESTDQQSGDQKQGDEL